MTKALIALHFQNDICHPDGLIPFAVDRSGPAPGPFLDRCRSLFPAREAGWLIAHVHIAFQPDYSDLPRNAKLFRAAEELGALKRGLWGAGPCRVSSPRPAISCSSMRATTRSTKPASRTFCIERGVTDIAVAGLATQYSVEHTVRHAADLGYSVTMVRDCCCSANVVAAAASFAAMALLADVKNLDEMSF